MMTRDLPANLYRSWKKTKFFWIDDVYTGMVAFAAQAKFIDSPFLLPDGPKFTKPDEFMFLLGSHDKKLEEIEEKWATIYNFYIPSK